MDSKISVIVPVFNTADYLDRCLNSLCEQTMKNIEVILVDDGSTDSSSDICDTYASLDSRIRVIHQSHQGVAIARNNGVKASVGKYIMFVDSDDWALPEYCEQPYYLAEKNKSDLVVFNYCVEGKRELRKQKNTLEEGLISKSDAMKLLDESMVGTGSWNKLYKKELFQTTIYPAGRVYEDVGTIYKLIHKADRIYYLPTSLYYYTDYRKGSITEKKDIKCLTDKYDMFFQRAQDLISWGYDYREQLEYRYLSYLIHLGRRQKRSEECEYGLRRIKGYPKLFTWQQKGMLFLYRHSPLLFDAVCRATGKRDI